MSKKYIVSLTAEERQMLEQLTKRGFSPTYKVNHARILFRADTSNEDGGWTDKAISKALDISTRDHGASAPTIDRARNRSCPLATDPQEYEVTQTQW